MKWCTYSTDVTGSTTVKTLTSHQSVTDISNQPVSVHSDISNQPVSARRPDTPSANLSTKGVLGLSRSSDSERRPAMVKTCAWGL